MKIFILTFIICLNVIGLNAQRLTNSSRSTIGYIENGRVMGSNRSTLGYIDGERITNSSRSTIGYFANGRVMNSSRSTIGYLDNGRVTNSSRSTIGYWENGRIMNSSRSTLGYYEGVNDEQASLFFFFFFYGSVTSQIPTLSTSEVSNLGNTTATSGGNVSADGGATVTARGVVWSTNPTPVISLSTKTSNGTGTGTFSSSLTSLSPNITYFVRAYATNSAGTAYGNEVSFKTSSNNTNNNNTVTSSNLTSSTSIIIKKTWSQQPNGYTYPMNIFVPTGAVPQGGFPVCILLHGNGGNGPGMVNQFLSTLSCHILVAPSGYQNSWNICAENSDAPDVEMIQDLVNNLQGYTNVNPNKIRILGSSNGAGLANRVFIENTNPGIDIICAIVSHLNEPQYHSGNFYKPGNTTDPSGSFCGYNVLATPLKSRKYLSISNDNDNLIPYLGGTSVVGVSFLAAETAALTIAKYKGHTNNILATGVTMGDPSITEFSYLSGDVVHLKGNAMHGTNATQRSYIKKYFSDCQASTSVPAILPAGVFEISPNPASDYVDILSMSEMPEKVTLQLIGLNGQQLLTKNINGIIAGESIRLPLNHIHSGLYFLRIQTEKGVWVRKMEIMR
ncbi:MAG: T9SS type A sorting domain-containing protein [Saprospiraceae bacterium]|nr:T9SS type A sorting domain-containing protein [Saprospiraceae bacterium]MDP4852242.1 T9SS type A sorting domain-containing protein [Saprospiraceae bacterium]